MIDASEVERILRTDAAPDDAKADAWDAFHGSPNHWALHEHLRTLPLADDTKAALLRAKFQSLPAAVRAIGLMETMNRAAIDRAESHSQVLQAMLSGRKS